MATVTDLGKQVKAKYPGQYDDMADDALGRAVKAKYPGAYDDFSDAPAVGFGDVKAAEHARGADWEGTGNVPTGFLTGDPETDRRIAQNLAAQGYRHNLTPGDALRAGAAVGSVAAPFVLGPVAAGAAGAGLFTAATSPKEGADLAKDVGASTVVGAAIPKAFEYFGKAAGPIADWLGEKAVKYGRKAITGVTAPLARRKELPEAAVRAAFEAGAIKPLSTVEGVAGRLQNVADPLAERYGKILQQLEAAGVTGPNAQKLAANLAAEGAKAEANSIIGTRAGALKDTAEALVGSPGGHMRPPIPAKPTDVSGNLGLMQSELMKRELQADAASQYVKEGATSLAGAAKKEIAGRFKDAIEQAVAEQAARAPEAAAQFQPVKTQLHDILTALGPAREAAARYSRRQPLGLHEAMGLATGIASSNPIQGVGAAGLMSALKERGASTLAAGAKGAEGLVRALPQAGPESAALVSPAVGRGAPATLEELLAFLRSKGLGVRAPTPALGEEENR